MFQTPKMKLFNFEQFQSMLNQIQITALASISPKNTLPQQQNFNILNQQRDGRTHYHKAANGEGDSRGISQITQISEARSQGAKSTSPMNNQHLSNNNLGINISNERKQLKDSNSSKSIGGYSSRSGQLQIQQQQTLQNVDITKNTNNRNTIQCQDKLLKANNLATCASIPLVDAVVKERGRGNSFEEALESLHLRELSCSIEEDEDLEENGNSALDNDNIFGVDYNGEISSSQYQRFHQNQYNLSIQNNPTTISRSNSQSMLDPLLQNLNVKKMCEVQKHFCKKRIREFRQPCEEIVQYQEFIKMVNDRCSRESALPMNSNRRIKTDHSMNSLKQKPPTNPNNLNSINNHSISQNYQPTNISLNSTQPLQPINKTNTVTYNRGIPQQLQAQPITNLNQIAPNCILKQQQNNQQVNPQKTDSTYSEITSKVFKLKKKMQPTLQENILAQLSQQPQQNQLSLFNSNKENSVSSNYSYQRNTLKNNNNNSYNLHNSINNTSQNNTQTLNTGSRDISACNYESKNNKYSIAVNKNQNANPQYQINCPQLLQQQQLQQQLNNSFQKNHSPYYSKKGQQAAEKENKTILYRDHRANSINQYTQRNSSNLNGTGQISKQSNNPVKNQSSSSNNTQYPLISSRSRVSTTDCHEKTQIDSIPQILQPLNQTKNNNNNIINGRQNISKSFDTSFNCLQLQQGSNGQQSNVSNGNKNIVTFSQSYYKRQQHQQQLQQLQQINQQQSIKNSKNNKNLNFNCLGYLRKYKEILEVLILPNIANLPQDDIIEYQNAYKQSVLIMSDQVGITSNEDLTNFQDFLSLRSKNIYNQFLSKYGVVFQI